MVKRYVIRLILVIGLLSLAGITACQSGTSTIADVPESALPSPQYTVFDGDGRITITTKYDTVQQLLFANNITLRPEDIVQPAHDQPPTEKIIIQRAQPISVHSIDGVQTYWTQKSTLGGFLFETGITLAQTNQVIADGRLIPLNSLDQTPLPAKLEIGRTFTVFIQDGGKQQILKTGAQTVAAALQEAGITPHTADTIEPSLQTPLTPDMTIQLTRALPLTIVVDGRNFQTYSHHTTPFAVLAEAGIELTDHDTTQPGPDTMLQPGDTIRVIRVHEEYLFEDETLPFATIYQASDQLAIDTQAVLSNGVPGIKRKRIRVRSVDGVEVSREMDSEWVEEEPVNQVIGYGTKITLGTIDTENGPREYWRVVNMRVTAYTAASSGKEPGHPTYGITASGRPAGTGIVAIDPSVVPFRSEVYVPGYGIGYAGDTGGGVKGRWIDLGYDEDELQAWNSYVDVYYLTPIPEQINYLIPQVLP